MNDIITEAFQNGASIEELIEHFGEDAVEAWVFID